MRLVVARCTVEYHGRLESVLPEAIRLLMIKADGCVAIHADGGAYKPLNWMNAPNTIREQDGRWEITNSKGETLTVILHEVLSDTLHELGDDPGLSKDGVEAHLQELLAVAPHHIEEGLVTIRREHQTAIGPVDLLCRAVDGDIVAVEVKRRGDIDGVEQLCRYLEYLRQDPAFERVRGVFVAQSVKPQARTLAESRGLGWREVDYDVLRGAKEADLTLF